jgi:hypothetical protein
MSNVKVVKVDNLKLSGGSTKKSKKNPPKNVEYLQNIVRDNKKTPYIDLTQSELINKLLSKKSKKNMEVRISKKTEPEKKQVEPEKKQVEPEKKKLEPEKKKLEPEKKKLEPEKKQVEPEKKTKIESSKLMAPKVKLPKKVGKKPSKKTIMSFFSEEDRKKIKRKTKRIKKIISSNLIAPKIDKKSKRNLYKLGVRNILAKDSDGRKEINKMTREQLMKELVKNKIIEKESNAPTKVLKDLHQLYLIVGANISKQD